jgi:hypothetical protein
MDPAAGAAIAALAHDCPLLSRARALAAFVGDGRALTAKGVLRRAEIAPACAAAGLSDPGRVVTAADVPALHRAWVAAQGAGLLVLGLDRAVGATPAGDPVAQWLGGLTALLRAESGDAQRIGATVTCRVALRVLVSASGIDRHWFGQAVEDVLDQLPTAEQVAAYHAFRRGTVPETGALELLAECGAVDPATLAVTPLGRWALDALAEPPAPAPAWADDDILQLKIGLDGFRPPVWRRVLVPAGTSLGRLHHIVQIALEWADDHLHVFTVGGIGYADASVGLDGCGDEETVTLASALPRPGATLAYRYDLGDCWDHTILLEKALPAEPGARPTCVGGRGDAPVEDWNHDEPPPARPFPPARDRRPARRARHIGRIDPMTDQPGLFDLPPSDPPPPMPHSGHGRTRETWARTVIAEVTVVDRRALRDKALCRLDTAIVIGEVIDDDPDLTDPRKDVVRSCAAAVQWCLEPAERLWPLLEEALRIDEVELATTSR